MRIQPIDASAHTARAEEVLKGDLPFGRVFTPHMLTITYDRDHGWHDPKIEPKKSLILDPASMVLHYGQETFEGLKAHKQDNDNVILFRLEASAKRLARSCARLCMPTLPEEIYCEAVKALVSTEYAWVPKREGASMYLRPTMIATEPALGVRPAANYLFFILATATGPYFVKGFSGIRVAVERKMVRAAPGGLGTAKTGANYVASLYAAEQAKKLGCDQVLWLDAIEHKYVEETGASNVFWLDGKTLCTTSLGDTVLAGITRDSLLSLAPKMGLDVKEMRISIDDLVSGIRSGRITEMFGSGTAAVVSPISELLLDDEIVRVADGKPGPVSKQLLDAVVNIHRGRAEDQFGWCHPVARPAWL